MTGAVAWLVLAALGAATPYPCTCAEDVRTNGWCPLHRIGYVAGLPIRSLVLYETLDAHGHAVDLGTFDCPTCREAIRTGGFCETHRVGFTSGRAYFSRLTYELSRAKPAAKTPPACPRCRENTKDGGWCDACGLGRIGPFVFDNRAAFDRVLREVRILRDAIEVSARCEECAAAMVTDTQCPIHRITYRDGRPVPSP